MIKDASNPAVLSVSSQVSRGAVGNRAAIFAIQTLGLPVWAVSTVQMAWHPGHGPSKRLVPDDTEFEIHLQDLANSPWVEELGGILTGYMANAAQVKAVSDMVMSLKLQFPDLVYLCDPVIGDSAGLYVAEETAAAIRDLLLPQCDMATPNRYELAWLTASNLTDEVGEICNLARKLDPETVLVTSVCGYSENSIGNLLISDAAVMRACHPFLPNVPNGTGDLVSAVFLSNRLRGLDNPDNLQHTTNAVFEILQQSVVFKRDELAIEAGGKSIRNPDTAIGIEILEGEAI